MVTTAAAAGSDYQNWTTDITISKQQQNHAAQRVPLLILLQVVDRQHAGHMRKQLMKGITGGRSWQRHHHCSATTRTIMPPCVLLPNLQGKLLPGLLDELVPPLEEVLVNLLPEQHSHTVVLVSNCTHNVKRSHNLKLCASEFHMDCLPLSAARTQIQTDLNQVHCLNNLRCVSQTAKTALPRLQH